MLINFELVIILPNQLLIVITIYIFGRISFICQSKNGLTIVTQEQR